MTGQKPREIAAQVLARRHRGGEFTETLLDRALAAARLARADAALCRELVCGVVRWQATLDWLIARKTQSRTQKAGLQDLLRLGLYQIFWLDRIPDHAAVHETVELARQRGFGAQAGFVNAVLRGYLREQGETRKLLADLKVAQPALGWSHPEWLVARWRQRWGDIHTRQLLEWNNMPPKTFARVNTLKFDSGKAARSARDKTSSNQTGAQGVTRPALENAGDLLTQWRNENVEYDFVRGDWFEESLVFELKSFPSLSSLPSFQQGLFYIQDPSTLLAVRELDPRPGETILDFCAAPGGKTSYIAQLMRNAGRLVAQDVSPERLELVRENCARLGVTCVETISNRPLASGPRPFDKILVDAPCSNTGVLRRRVDLRWRLRAEEIERLRQSQLALLREAAPRVKAGGVLVYSTCSLEPEENPAVVKQFLGEQAGFKLERERELLPFADGVDGAYVATLRCCD